MAAAHQHQLIRDWLVSEKDCQTNDYFAGTTLNPTIADGQTGESVSPEVVGIRYEPRDTATARFDFHFYFVVVATDSTTETMQSVMGKVESLRVLVDQGTTAADSAVYYVALPTLDVPRTLRSWAEAEDVGLISVEEDRVVHETLSAESEAVAAVGPVSNTDQQSPGNFRKAVECSTVLAKVVTSPKGFYDAEVRPENEAYDEKLGIKQAKSYVDDKSAEAAFRDFVSRMEAVDDFTVRPSGSKPDLRIEASSGERSFKAVPQRENFKVLDDEGEVLYRVSAKDDVVDFAETDVDDLDGVVSYVLDHLDAD